jgi:protocatechuate 3,4-dioxygenase beta subunit
VAGASVRVFDRGIAARPARWRSRISGPPQAVTGEDGRFRLAGLPAGSLHDLQILANGFQPVVLEGIEAPTERPVQLVLEPAAEVAGRVVDAREEAVEGARVSVVLVSLHPDLEREVASELVEDRTVLTDAEGRFALSELRPGKGSLTVVADGHLRPEPIPLDLEEGSRHDGILVRVLEGARIEGRVVTEDGEPVEGVRVAVEDSGGFTDADGTYGFDGVPIGQMEIAASHPRYHHELREVDVEPGINSVDWTFPVGRAVAGRVTDPAGDPVSGAVVRLATEEGVGGRELRTIAAADGGFRFDPVPSDEYRLEGEAPGFSATVAPDPVRVADRSLDGLQLTLRPGVLLTGRVTGLDAEALSRVRVEVSAADDGRTLDASVDWEGVYELRDLSPGDWRLRASLERDRRQVEARVPIDPGAGTVRRDLVFTDGSTLSGTVLYDAEPLMGASVSVRGLTSGLERSVRTDLDGRFEIADLEPGRYWLGVVHRPRRVIHNAEVELDASRDLSIDVSATTLEGQVTDARTGQPLERARVELRRADGVVGAEGLTLVVTDTAGAYYVARLTAGPYELTVHRDGYAPLYRSLAIAARPGSEVLDFSLEPARGLELLVQGVGPPPSHLDVLVEGPGGGWIERGRRRVAPDGRVSLSTLADGSWRLLVARPDGAPVPLQVTVPSTAPVPVDLPPATPVRVVVPDLRSSARIAQLRIFVPDGTPVSLVDLTVGLRDTWPLEAGRAAVGALPPGAYTFEVLGADGGRWVSTYEIGSGGGPLEVVVGSPTDTPPRS